MFYFAQYIVQCTKKLLYTDFDQDSSIYVGDFYIYFRENNRSIIFVKNLGRSLFNKILLVNFDIILDSINQHVNKDLRLSLITDPELFRNKENRFENILS